MELVKQRTFSVRQICVGLSRPTSSSKLDILSDFKPKIIKPNHLALEHEHLRKESLFTKTASLKTELATFLYIVGMLKNISTLTNDSRLMNIALILPN